MAHTETYIDGVLYPSVTTVLGAKPKPWLDKWREKWGVLAQRKTAASNAIGTAFHKLVESYIETGLFPAPSTARLARMMRVFLGWADSVDVEIVQTEMKVVSHKHKYSGTLDAVGLWRKKLVVFDWKTSTGINPDMALQLCAYARAYEEMTGKRVSGGCIVLVAKKNKAHKLIVEEYDMTKALFNKFLRRLQDYNKMQKAAA